MSSPKKIKITQVKSTIAAIPNHKLCMKGLGLRRIRHSLIVDNTPCIMGMIEKVKHLLKIEEV
jgi:large subunit ribosomal protein L30